MENHPERVDCLEWRRTLHRILAEPQQLTEREDRPAKQALQETLAQLKAAVISDKTIPSDGPGASSRAGDDLSLQALCEQLVSGRWNGDPVDIQRNYWQYELTIARAVPAFLVFLAQSGRLDDELFRRAATRVPRLLHFIPYSGPPVPWLAREIGNDEAASLQPFTRRLVTSIAAQPLDEQSAELLVAASQGHITAVGSHLEGAGFLAVAAREHAALEGAGHNFGTLKMGNSYRRDSLYRALLEMARGARPLPADHLPSLARELKQFPARTLQALLPVAHPDLRGVLLQALGWEEAYPLVILLGAGGASAFGQIESVGNSPDPDNGVINITAARNALAQAGEDRTRQLFKLFRQAQCGLGNELFLLEAILGWNRDEVLERKQRRQQVSVKAFGLLPLQEGSDEVLERYLWLRRFEKESNRYGAGRQATERAAVQVALHNLAQVAGFGDAQRLEWQMEKRLGSEQLAPGRSWQVDDYTVVLQLQEVSPALVISRGEKQLKSIPAAVRRHADYEAMKEAVQALREQATRVRSTLEAWMAAGEWLAPNDVRALLALPVGRYILQALILQAEDGACGLLDPASRRWQEVDGRRQEAGERLRGPLRIAHPYHLEARGALGAWQRALVRGRVTQPLRQAFRELYLLTPAEQETATYSNRFAGQRVDAARAYRLFQSRRWRLPQQEYGPPMRLFVGQGLRACFAFEDVGHYFSESDTVTSGAIYFERLDSPAAGGHPWQRIPLAEVPPLLFSEVMRDADLVVSVAQWTAEAAARRAEQRAEADRALQRRSEEAFRRQAELVQVLLEDLGIEGVEVVGHFALVRGTLASYRVHLGSGSVFVEPGNYLCIVPDGSARQPPDLFLPFVDSGSERAGVVISKILLLLNDASIKDPAILRQIRRVDRG